jgi:hypothetical protein
LTLIPTLLILWQNISFMPHLAFDTINYGRAALGTPSHVTFT